MKQEPKTRIGRLISGGGAALLAVLLVAGLFGMAAPAAAQQGSQDAVRQVQPNMPMGGAVPGDALGSNSDSEIWRAIRGGATGTVSIPNKQAGQMIQSEGDNWRAIRNGPVTVLGGTLVLLFIGITALFFLVRGRVRIDAGRSGKTVERFNGIERFAHWMTAVSFIILSLSGLNLLYGKHVLIPLLGKESFAMITELGKLAHNYLAFPFLIGVALMFVLWVVHNLPSRHDLTWISQAGGLFVKGMHPPAKKFNAGQKVIFWVVILSGLSLGLSGWSLLFPFTTTFFGDTFALLNKLGADLPTELTLMEEMQLSQLWHGVVGLVAMGIIVGHIYIGSLGMEGAFAAMGSGQVDQNWAREHHSIWAEEAIAEAEAAEKTSAAGERRLNSAGRVGRRGCPGPVTR